MQMKSHENSFIRLFVLAEGQASGSPASIFACGFYSKLSRPQCSRNPVRSEGFLLTDNKG